MSLSGPALPKVRLLGAISPPESKRVAKGLMAAEEISWKFEVIYEVFKLLYHSWLIPVPCRPTAVAEWPFSLVGPTLEERNSEE